VSLGARVQRMMSLIGSQPVMWVDLRSLLASGPYSEANMQQWNRALLRACARYPSMRVYNWAGVAKRNWFIPDGIHFTANGYAQRSRLIANALAKAFPATPQATPRELSPMVTGGAADAGAGCLVS
jgi:hypothetical protein